MIDHHILGLRHVVERPGHPPYDLAFPGSGVVLLALGAWLIQASRPSAALVRAT